MLSLEIKHVHRHVRTTELANKLPAHPARRARRAHIRRHTKRAEPRLPLRNRLHQRGALSTDSNWVRSVLDIGAGDPRAVFTEERGADTKVRVRACLVRRALMGGVEGAYSRRCL